MSGYPAYGTELIRCATRGCKWRGYETERIQKPDPKFSWATTGVCPSCGKPDYYFLNNPSTKEGE